MNIELLTNSELTKLEGEPGRFFAAVQRRPRFVDLLALVLRARPAQRLLLKLVAKRRMEKATLDAYFRNFIGDAGVRGDVTRFLKQISNRHTLEAARRFPEFRRPVLIAWGEDDPFFLPRYARRLEHDFPDARLRFLPASRAFVPEDQPNVLARCITDFVPSGSGVEVPAGDR